MKKNIKRKIFIIIVLFFSFNLRQTISKADYENENVDVSIEQYNLNISQLNKITTNELIQMNNDKKSYTLYIGRPNCYYCRLYSENIKTLNEKLNNALYYYDLDSGELTNEIIDLIVNEWKISGTPAFLVFDNGVLLNKYEGADLSIDDLYSILTNSSTGSNSSENQTDTTYTSSSTSESSNTTDTTYTSSSTSESSITINTSLPDIYTKSANKSTSINISSTTDRLPKTGETSLPWLTIIGIIISLCTSIFIINLKLRKNHPYH